MRLHEFTERLRQDALEARVIGFHKSKLKAGDRIEHPMIAGNFGIVKKIENNVVIAQGVKDRKMYTLSVLQVTPVKEDHVQEASSCKKKKRK